MSQKQYEPDFLTDILAEWDYNISHGGMSMRRFCEDWNVPRSTFQGWLRSKNAAEIPADRYYAKHVETEVKKAPINPEVVDVLRMLASELAAISSDLDELLMKL